MKNAIKKSCITLATLFFTLSAFAQTTSGNSANQLKRLLQLNGYWQAPDAVLHVSDKEFKFVYSADFKKTADNNGLTMNEWGNIPRMGQLNGANLIGIDPYDGKVHWYSVDNMGTTHEHIGEFTDDNHFTMMHKSIREGKEYIETITFVLSGADKMDFKLVATLDGKEQEAITGTFRRKTKKYSE